MTRTQPKRTMDGCWMHTLECIFEELIALRLHEDDCEPRAKHKVGRPRLKPEFAGPKRPRGRSRKNQ